MLEDGSEEVERAVKEAAETHREFDQVFGHNWASRHAYHTGEECGPDGV